jgi:hypothetical protein
MAFPNGKYVEPTIVFKDGKIVMQRGYTIIDNIIVYEDFIKLDDKGVPVISPGYVQIEMKTNQNNNWSM